MTDLTEGQTMDEEPRQDKRCIYCHAVLIPGLTSIKCHSNVRATGEPGSHVWARAGSR